MTKGRRDDDQDRDILNHSISGLMAIEESEVKSIKILREREGGGASSQCNLIYLGWLISMVGLLVSEEKQWRREWMGVGDKREGGGRNWKEGRNGKFWWDVKTKKIKKQNKN